MADKAPSFWTDPDEKKKALRWAMGLGATWIVLTLMVDLGDTADLGVAFALVIMGSVLLAYGPKALEELGVSTSPTGGRHNYIVEDYG